MTTWRARSAISLAAGALAIAPAALADPPGTPPRADAYYAVMCLAPGATEPASFEQVDGHALDPGNKDDQVARYGAHHPGWTCWLVPGA